MFVPDTVPPVGPRPTAMEEPAPQTVSDAVVVGIRRAILAGDILPGQRLVEAELAQQFGGSRATARAALIALEGEGIVERMHNRGARVRVVTVQEAIELTDVRTALEGLCAGQAASRITDDEVQELKSIGEQMRHKVDEDDDVGYSELNRQLHERIIEIADHGVAQEMLKKIRGRSGITHRLRHQLHPRRLGSSLQEHLDIIEALSLRDSEKAESSMRRHLSGVRRTLTHERA